MFVKQELGCDDDGTDPLVVAHVLCPNACSFKNKCVTSFNLFLPNVSKQISLVLFTLMHILSQFLVQAYWRIAGGHCQNTSLLNRIDLIFHSRFGDKIPVSEKRSHKRTQHSSAPVVSYLIPADRHECCYVLTRRHKSLTVFECTSINSQHSNT